MKQPDEAEIHVYMVIGERKRNVFILAFGLLGQGPGNFRVFFFNISFWGLIIALYTDPVLILLHL
jgi:hypothetical protein